MEQEPMTAQDVIARLGLTPHPAEGGFFRETWRATEETTALPVRYTGARSFGTAIYYLLTPETFSHLHRLTSDEVFHFYLGDPVQQLCLHPDGTQQSLLYGHDLRAGQVPQAVVPAGVWQGARLCAGGRWALLGCTVAPGFDFADYCHASRDELVARWPEAAAEICRLTVPLSSQEPKA